MKRIKVNSDLIGIKQFKKPAYTTNNILEYTCLKSHITKPLLIPKILLVYIIIIFMVVSQNQLRIIAAHKMQPPMPPKFEQLSAPTCKSID